MLPVHQIPARGGLNYDEAPFLAIWRVMPRSRPHRKLREEIMEGEGEGEVQAVDQLSSHCEISGYEVPSGKPNNKPHQRE